jgi:excisionase family DNA binding protein
MQSDTLEMMTTVEVARYLRLGERTIYDLVKREEIPCARITGKLLFPRRLIDLWVARHVDLHQSIAAPPPVLAGSHDPLLEWASRESGCDLALLTGGSLDGLRRLADGRAVLAGIHLVDAATGDYNIVAARAATGLGDLVLIQWAYRLQGLIVPPGNPRALRSFADIVRSRARFAQRQEGAGAQTLFRHLLARDGLAPDELVLMTGRALTEAEIATAVADGKADAGLAIEAVARRHRLGFVPLQRERFDLALRRRDYFEPPVQALVAFIRTERFREQAEALGGYEVGATGTVMYNA